MPAARIVASASEPNITGSLGGSGVSPPALYASPSYSSLFLDPEDLEPGPGTYDIATALGHQLLSQRDSAPERSITAKHDRSWARVFISKEHLSNFRARDTPGPGTYQPKNHLESEARVRFGNSNRPLGDVNFRSPGAVYDLDRGPQVPIHKVRFSKGNRFPADGEERLSATGPGQYELSTVFDGQNLAKSFGASHRAYDRVRFPGSERENIGKASPGPGPASDYRFEGGVSFTKADRLPKNRDGRRAPGPGTYENHNMPSPSSRRLPVHSFGKPHAKGRINWREMRKYESTSWGMN